MEVHLVVLEGKQKGQAIPLPETIFLIGRDNQCHLRPHCQGVSMLHCAIAAWAGKVRLRDLGSRNGTFLNGQPVQGEVGVKDGDQLQVGTLVFAFRITNEPGAARVAPIRSEREVGWLLDAPTDSSVLAPAMRTCELPAHASRREGAETDPAGAPGSKAVSAGEHLRTYFAQRKQATHPVTGPEMPRDPEPQ
jgi:pSer/pThr/pTyr-binding forkhead associated (FHA) protein